MSSSKKLSVFVLGASGYIGEAVAQAYRRQGHNVFGLVRSADSAKKLQVNEIVPVLGDQDKVDGWISVATQCAVLIDAIGYNDNSGKTFEAFEAAGKQRVAQGHSKPLYIFTSGIMVYGHAYEGRVAPLDETVACKPFDGHIHGVNRGKYEQRVLYSTAFLHPVVIRPGWVYGGNGGHYLSLFFGQVNIQTNAITLKGKPEKRYSWVHLEDLADAYVKVAHVGGEVLNGQLFNIVAREYPSSEEIIRAAAVAAGLDLSKTQVIKEEVSGNSAFFETTVIIDPKKAEQLLHWKASRVGFIEEMSVYYKGWIAGPNSAPKH